MNTTTSPDITSMIARIKTAHTTALAELDQHHAQKINDAAVEWFTKMEQAAAAEQRLLMTLWPYDEPWESE